MNIHRLFHLALFVNNKQYVFCWGYDNMAIAFGCCFVYALWCLYIKNSIIQFVVILHTFLYNALIHHQAYRNAA